MLKMDLADTTKDPNLNAEMYRNMRAADAPPVADKHLQFILVYNDDSAILGASNMTDRYWSGTVWCYADTSNFDRHKSIAGTKTESGVCDAAYLGEKNKFVIGEDSGVIQVLSMVEMADTRTQELQCLGYTCQHDDGITSLSTFQQTWHLVTGGMDYCIKVWDLAEMISTSIFSPAHTDIVTCVNAKPKSDSVFASTSLDCEALVWDIRQPKPASRVLQKERCGLTSVAWSPAEEHVIAIGAANGSVLLIDSRSAGSTPLHEFNNAFSRGVHRLTYDPERPHRMAGCCDNTEVQVFDTNKGLNVIYKDDRHKDFVRGLAWHNNQLITCSWDGTILKHSPPS